MKIRTHSLMMAVICLGVIAGVTIANTAFAKKKKAAPIPKNLEGCFVALKAELSPANIDLIKEDKAGKMYEHMALGAWIRNNWIRPKGSPLAKYFNDMGIVHPDDMSTIIVESFRRHLNGKPIKLSEQVKHYKDYWKKRSSEQQ